MTDKLKRRHAAKPLPPDDPIYTGGFVIFTPASARPSPTSTDKSKTSLDTKTDENGDP
jgi:hypothetical protein